MYKYCVYFRSLWTLSNKWLLVRELLSLSPTKTCQKTTWLAWNTCYVSLEPWIVSRTFLLSFLFNSSPTTLLSWMEPTSTDLATWPSRLLLNNYLIACDNYLYNTNFYPFYHFSYDCDTVLPFILINIILSWWCRVGENSIQEKEERELCFVEEGKQRGGTGCPTWVSRTFTRCSWLLPDSLSSLS